MWEWMRESEALVYLAGLSLVFGYIITNQLVLRLWIVVGTVLYIAYYATAAATPLWGAIYMSLAMGAANFVGIASLLWHRSRRAVPAAHADLYDQHFAHIPPGDFRALMARADRHVLRAPQVLTEIGRPVDQVTFVIAGQAEVEKEGERFMLPPGLFFGEVSYILGGPASATCTVPAGAEVVIWRRGVLDEMCRKPRLKLAFEAAVAYDMARKVSVAVAPARLRVAPDVLDKAPAPRNPDFDAAPETA
ncbi:Crp/Fnr family transcriptional regulator [Pseudaestuariivita sp.]|uniref:Crp/Fnr family transcriptional regulator n=1 Tax=Pseudaestuariivita sp. TaxID=2211669 RepID=UPI00405950A5